MIIYSTEELGKPKLQEKAKEMVNAASWKRKNGYTSEKMVIGLLGESIYSKHTNQPINFDIYVTGDGGVDFPDGSNVKTRKISDIYGGGYVPGLIVSVKDLNNNKIKSYVYAVYNPYVEKVALIGKILADRYRDRMEEWSGAYKVEIDHSLANFDEVYDDVTYEELQAFCKLKKEPVVSQMSLDRFLA